MIEVKQNKLQMFGICIVVIALSGVVTAQEAQPYQYTPPFQNAFTNDRRRYNEPYNGFNDASLPSNGGDAIRFPDDGMSPVSLIRGFNDENNFNERHKKDNRYSQKSNEVSALMQQFLRVSSSIKAIQPVHNSTNALHFYLNYHDSFIPL